jgi:hypothetical protein
MGRAAARIMLAGIAKAQAFRERRDDPQLRVAAARNVLLRWMYEQHLSDRHMPIPTDVLASPRATYMGKPFTEAEVRRAAAYLAAKDLIKGPGAWGSAGSPVRASITPQGQDCVEEYGGDVSEYLRDQARGGIVNEIGTFNQHGGAVAFGNTGPITQNVASGPGSRGHRSTCLFAAVWTGRGALVTESVAPTPYMGENLARRSSTRR